MEENEKMNEQTVAPIEEIDANAETPAREGQATEGEKPISKKKKILNGIFLGLQIAMVVVSIILTLILILNPKTDDVTGAGIKLLPVLTGSMDGDKEDSFPAGSLVIATTPKNGAKDLKEGVIVTFPYVEKDSGETILVTHRIIEVVPTESGVRYRTQGDANLVPDEELKSTADIKAIYSFHIKRLGWAINWIRSGYNFIYVIIIPLGLLLIYNIYLVAQIVVEGKMKKAKEAAAESAKQAALAQIDEEEIKRRAIEEYLKSQAAAAAGGKEPKDGDTE